MSFAKINTIAANAALDAVFGSGTPATFWIALTSGGTELSGSGYARVSITNNNTNFTAASSGLKLLAVAQAFAAATANWSNVDGWALYDASSSGNAYASGDTADLPVLATGDASTDTFTSSSHGLTNGQKVRVEAPTGVSLPAGVSAATDYYVVGATTNTFQLSATSGGSAIDLTGYGAAYVALWYGKSGIAQNDVVQFPANSVKLKVA